MKFIATRLEILFSVLFIMAFEGIFWPPNSYFTEQKLPLDASDPWSFGATASLLTFLALAFFFRRRQIFALLRAAWPVLLLLLLAFLSAFWSDAPELVLRRATTLGATTLFGVYLVARFDFARLVAILVKISAFAAAASFVVAAAAPNRALEHSADYPTAWRGAFTDKNTLGLWAAIGMMAALYALWNGYGSRLVALAVIPANLALLYLSKSGTPSVMLLVALYVAIVLLAFRRRSGAGMAAGFVLAAVGVLVGGLAILEWNDILLLLHRNPTLTGRDRIWAVVLDYIWRKPFLGYGFGAFWRHDAVEAQTIWGALHWTVPHAHNALLEIGLALGFVGMAATVFVWVDTFYRGLRVLTVPQARHAVFLLALLAAMLVENVTEYEFLRGSAFLWVLFVVAAVHLGQNVLLWRAVPRPRPVRPVPALAYPQRRPGFVAE